MNALVIPLYQLNMGLSTYVDKTMVEQILDTNRKAADYGLTLTKENALELVQTRNLALGELGRLEVGSMTINKLIDAFCDSAYINQQEYVEILNDLVEIFYYMKNETMDLVSDDDLIDFMKESFEKKCNGSLELLRDRELERMAEKIRSGERFFLFDDETDKDDEDEEEEEMGMETDIYEGDWNNHMSCNEWEW